MLNCSDCYIFSTFSLKTYDLYEANIVRELKNLVDYVFLFVYKSSAKLCFCFCWSIVYDASG